MWAPASPTLDRLRSLSQGEADGWRDRGNNDSRQAAQTRSVDCAIYREVPEVQVGTAGEKREAAPCFAHRGE